MVRGIVPPIFNFFLSFCEGGEHVAEYLCASALSIFGKLGVLTYDVSNKPDDRKRKY